MLAEVVDDEIHDVLQRQSHYDVYDSEINEDVRVHIDDDEGDDILLRDVNPLLLHVDENDENDYVVIFLVNIYGMHHEVDEVDVVEVLLVEVEHDDAFEIIDAMLLATEVVEVEDEDVILVLVLNDEMVVSECSI